jgi:hypothetical protein
MKPPKTPMKQGTIRSSTQTNLRASASSILAHDSAAPMVCGVGWLVLLPVILIGSAAVASFLFVRLSTLRITTAGVEIRNYPQAPKVVPLGAVDHFVPADRVGTFAFLRPATAVLLLQDGSRVPVRAVHEPEAGYGIDALNDRLAALQPDS